MFPIGGIGAMLVLIAAAGVVSALVARLLRGAGVGASLAITLGLLLWSVATVTVVTLIPVHVAPGVVRAEDRLPSFSSGLKLTQLALARLDRACDVTDHRDDARASVRVNVAA